MYFKWRSLRYFDWLSFTLTFTLALLGALFIFSATYTTECPFSIFFKKQIMGIGMGVFIYFFFALFDYRILMRWGYTIYLGIIGLLLFTLIKGTIGMGAQRWVSLFFFKLQPSELAKLFFPAFIAYHFDFYKDEKPTFSMFVPILGILGFSFLIIRKQPDLGTALVILFSGLILVWLSGIGRKFFLITGLTCALLAPCFWYVLKDYQKNRILVFLGSGNALKERYQIEQSMIAVGSGGITGKGLLNGTQNSFRFLPEGRTDFIFAVICEEIGFLGALFIIMLYTLLMLRLLVTALTICTASAQILATGLLIHILLSALINMCMVINMLPVVGIPLPLISYGLSNLWVTLASLGWIQSISINTQK